ncbi:MAG: glycosyltransferase family 4 protein [Immundisolibacter sp.]
MSPAQSVRRVLHLCPDPHYLTDLYALYRQVLDRPPFESTLMFLRGALDAGLQAQLGPRVHFLDLPREALEGLRLPALWRLWRACGGQRFDLVVAHRYKAFTLALALRRLGVARHVFGVVHEIGQFEGRRRELIRRIQTAPVTLIGVSEAVRADLAVRFPCLPSSQLRSLPNAVSDHPLLDPAQARAVLRLSPQRFWFGSVGRLVPVKGHDVLLRAFAALARVHPDVGLALVGSGRQEAALRELGQRLGIAEQVAFCGWRSDVRALLSAFEVCVFPSREEGFGLAIAEAMAAARPVIASATGGVPAVLGDQGLLVPPEDASALAAVLERLYRSASERRQLAMAAHERWRSQLSPPQFVARLRALACAAVGVEP